MRKCCICKRDKSLELFVRAKNKSGRGYVCLSCNVSRVTQWQRANPARSALSSRRRKIRKYGLDVTQFEEMIRKQNGRCSICREEQELCIDHNHKNGTVRGLLCHKCNRVLGSMKDSPDLLRRAVDYLEADHHA